MAKSIRSKRRRKMRSIKREKYGKKELERLKGIIENAQKQDVEMKELYTVKSAQDIKQSKNEHSGEDNSMDVDKKGSRANQKTLKNEHGNYPVWMSQRKVRRIKKQDKRKSKQKAKAKKS